MSWNDSPKERACLERAEIWKGLIGFCEEVEREEIEAKAVMIVPKGKEFYCGNLGVSVSEGLCGAARSEARRREASWPDGLGWLDVCLNCPDKAMTADKGHRLKTNRKPKTENRKQVLKGMSKAVARDLGLI